MVRLVVERDKPSVLPTIQEKAEAALDAILDLLDSRAEEWAQLAASGRFYPFDSALMLIAALRQPQEVSE
jgi:hypothetical protein